MIVVPRDETHYDSVRMPARSTRSRKKRRHTHKSAQIHTVLPTIAHGFIFVGALLILIWGSHMYFRNQTLRLSEHVISQFERTQNKRALPVNISFGNTYDLFIVQAGIVDGAWSISQNHANHVRQSHAPGEEGNIIIYGHNTNRVFGSLLSVRAGEIVRISTTDGKLHTYRISQTVTVPTDQTQWLTPTAHEVLTLYTCTGFLDRLRFVVRAVPVLEE